jgi:hypothetical protein
MGGHHGGGGRGYTVPDKVEKWREATRRMEVDIECNDDG